MTGPAKATAVARALVAFGDELSARGAAQTGGDFTDIAEADALVKESPEAFLIGVLFTQGIAAERAWAGPYLLKRRLGHLDLARLASERDAVVAAVCLPPALHRFKYTMAGWISDAAMRLLECWDGDASTVWAPGTSAVDVMRRLTAFSGIGRKKAAMAVEILHRHFGAAITDLDGGTVAYDVHVRRVFLRSGLAGVDTPEEIAAAAARACPGAPGRLDLPAWLIGRQWCRPGRPLCTECRLTDACPRLTERNVPGVGTRVAPTPRLEGPLLMDRAVSPDRQGT